MTRNSRAGHSLYLPGGSRPQYDRHIYARTSQGSNPRPPDKTSEALTTDATLFGPNQRPATYLSNRHIVIVMENFKIPGQTVELIHVGYTNTKTSLYNEDPLTSHFYIVKLGLHYYFSS